MQLVNDNSYIGIEANRQSVYDDKVKQSLFKRPEATQNLKITTGAKNLLNLNEINGEVQTTYRK